MHVRNEALRFGGAAVLLGLVLLATAAVSPNRASSQAVPSYATSSGLTFAVSGSLKPLAVPARLGGTAHVVEHMFSDGGEQPLQLFVVSSVGSVARGDRVLPADTEGARRELAQGFAAGAGEALKTLELRDVTARAYDPQRGAFALEGAAIGPSRARMMLDEPPAGAVWAAVRQSGQDEALLRCFLAQLLGDAASADAARLRANTPIAAERCGVTEERIERFTSAAEADAFAPTKLSLAALSFFLRGADVSFCVLAPEARKRDVDALAAWLMSSTVVPDAARLEGSAPARGYARLIGVVTGSVLSILMLGGLLAWLMVKRLQLPAARAVFIACASLNALVIVSLIFSRAGSAQGWVQLAVYASSSVLFYRPMTKWIATRTARAQDER